MQEAKGLDQVAWFTTTVRQMALLHRCDHFSLLLLSRSRFWMRCFWLLFKSENGIKFNLGIYFTPTIHIFPPTSHNP